MRVGALAVSLCFTASGLGLLTSCEPELAPGGFDTPRYFANVRGELPLAFVPPISDRSGNIYVLFGDPDEGTTNVWVGQASGGFTASCQVTDGNGVKRWVGRAQDAAYYQSGGALVRVSGRHGGCKRLLERDPSTGADLSFLAVLPLVIDSPSRVSTVAWIQSPTDPRPYQVLVDLSAGIYTLLGESADSGSDFEVLGVGGDPATQQGVIVYRKQTKDGAREQAVLLDRDGTTLDEVAVKGAEELPPAGLLGDLLPVSPGRYVGLAEDGRLFIVDGEGGRFRAVEGMEPSGVQRWGEQIYLVGVGDKGALVSAIDASGKQLGAQAWQASRDLGKALNTNVLVRDDRSLPAREVEWKKPVSALGAAPFLSPYSLDYYADGTTLWLVAGPDFESGGEPYTAVAVIAAGVSYP